MRFDNLTMEKVKREARKSKWIILFIILGSFLAIFINENYVKTRYYTSTVQILLSSDASDENSSQQMDGLKANIQLINTYQVIVKSERVMNEVSERINNKVTSEDLTKQTGVSLDNNSLVMTITYRDLKPVQSQEILEVIATVAEEQIPDLFSNTKVVILDSPTLGATKSSLPKYIVALFVGTFLAVSYVLFRSTLQTEIQTREQLENLGLTFLGDLPSVKGMKEVSNSDRRAYQKRSRNIKHSGRQ